MALDYKAFLGRRDTLVLPYFGGTRVDARDRRLRVERDERSASLVPGWYAFEVDGRRAVPQGAVPPPELGALPAVRGHVVSGWVVVDGRQLHRIALPPEDEPAALTRVVTRRWYSGEVLFDTIEFEDEAELAARQALEERRPLGAHRGVVPSLRAAFAVAVGLGVARELDVAVTPRELMGQVAAIADGGRAVVVRMFETLLEQRRREIADARRRLEEIEHAARLATATRGARAIARESDPVRRADEVLDRAGARLLSARRLAHGQQLDVTYEVDGTRILSLVDAHTLQVLDPGLCLSGAHRVLTLDAMPSVVREAIDEDRLNITRHA